jgi:hypothetical protein
MHVELEVLFTKHFGFLVSELGYEVSSASYSPSFGDFEVLLVKQRQKLRITSDRSQIFIELYSPQHGWRDKNDALKPTGHVQQGYQIEIQAAELSELRHLLGL